MTATVGYQYHSQLFRELAAGHTKIPGRGCNLSDDPVVMSTWPWMWMRYTPVST
jgi:hypothetical protein